MAELVKVDERKRITLSKSFGIRGRRAVIISAGTFPVSSEPNKDYRKMAKIEKAFEDNNNK